MLEILLTRGHHRKSYRWTDLRNSSQDFMRLGKDRKKCTKCFKLELSFSSDEAGHLLQSAGSASDGSPAGVAQVASRSVPGDHPAVTIVTDDVTLIIK